MSDRADGPTVAAACALAVVGLGLVALGVLLVPTGFLLGTTEPELTRLGPRGVALGIGVGLVEGVLVAGAGLLPLVAAAGIFRRRPWGWALAVVVSVAMLPTCALPVCAFTLAVLVRTASRRSFGVA